jgi:hypothetical protein
LKNLFTWYLGGGGVRGRGTMNINRWWRSKIIMLDK